MEWFEFQTLILNNCNRKARKEFNNVLAHKKTSVFLLFNGLLESNIRSDAKAGNSYDSKDVSMFQLDTHGYYAIKR